MAPIALAKPDKESTYLNCQVEHVEIAGALGRFKDEEIDVRRFKLTKWKGSHDVRERSRVPPLAELLLEQIHGRIFGLCG